MHTRLRTVGLALTLLLVAGACGGSSGSTAGAASHATTSTAPSVAPNTEDIASLTPMNDAPDTGAERLHFKVGPFTVEPGQNNIANRGAAAQQPPVDGWIVGIRPNLEYANGKTPGVDVIHLHHAVWLNMSAPDLDRSRPAPAVLRGRRGEDDPQVPRRLRLRVQGDRPLAPRLHAAQPHVEARTGVDHVRHRLHPRDIAGREAHRRPRTRSGWTFRTARRTRCSTCRGAAGTTASTPIPTTRRIPTAPVPAKNVWTVDQDGTLLGTAGHVHPGGLRDDLWLQRNGAVVPSNRAKPGSTDTVHLFSSVSHYYEPAGPVSWDVTMSATPDDWRVQVHKGDKLQITATYESKLASRGTRAWGSWSCG